MWMYQIHVSRKISDSTTGSEDDLSAQENVASDEPDDKVVNITCCNCGHVIKKVSEQAFRMARWTES
jgi:hypothetical protein